MRATITIIALIAGTLSANGPHAAASGDGLNDAVKTIEQFYRVKHKSIPLLARAAMKTARTAARIKGGDARRLAEAGSIRVAFFENCEFNSRGQMAVFKGALQRTLNPDWSSIAQNLYSQTEEQNYIFIREAGEKFHVLLVAIERHEATVVQATVRPEVIKQLLRNPEETGKALIEDATIIDN